MKFGTVKKHQEDCKFKQQVCLYTSWSIFKGGGDYYDYAHGLNDDTYNSYICVFGAAEGPEEKDRKTGPTQDTRFLRQDHQKEATESSHMQDTDYSVRCCELPKLHQSCKLFKESNGTYGDQRDLFLLIRW
ncbi:hypothetical protein E2320_022961 [Naja naja]|nr:hypothetical protein E2320_022961 [Naja naja]